MNGKQLKNSILQWAIQGKLVPQDPNDEPASVLLERIREEKARLVKEKTIKKDKNESIIFRGDDNSHYEKFADGTVKCIDDEIPFEIPQSWCWVRLGQVFSHCTGKALNGANKKGELYQYITTSNLYWDKFELTTLKEMYFTEDELDKCTAKKGDLLVCEGGDIGRSAIWNYDYDIRIQNHIHKLRSFMPICTRFFYYILYLYKGIGNIGGKGIGIQGLSSGALHNILLPFPSLNEQQRIVSKIEDLIPIVNKYEKSEEALNKLNAEIFDKLKKSVLQEAIQGKLVSQDPNDEPASVLLERIKEEKAKLFKEGKLKKKDLVDSVIFKVDDNKYYETIDGVTECIDEEIPYDLPSNWAWTRLGNVAKMTIGKTPARGDQRYWSNGEYSWVSISDMKDLGVISATKERISAIAVKELMGNISPKGSLLMSFKLTVGRTSLLDMDAYHNEAIVTVLPLIDECNTFRNYLFRTLPLLSVAGDSKDAIKGKTLNSQSLSRLLIPLPPMSEQERIVQELQRVTSLMN